MAGYLLADGIEFDANGLCDGVFEWTQNPDGTSSRSAVQAVNEDGLKLWNLGISWLDEGYQGRTIEKTGIVTVASATEPTPKRHKPLRFKNLRLHTSARLINRKAALIERFFADSWAQAGSNPTAPQVHKEQN